MGEDINNSLEPISKGEEFLEHHGIKGMRWGVRRSQAELDSGKPTPVIVKTSKGSSKIRTSGGTHQPASDDAIQAASVNQKLKKSGINSLSNKEMQDLVTRLNLQQQMNKLTPVPTKTRLKNDATKIITNAARTGLQQAANQAASFLIKKAFEQIKNKSKT